MTSRAEVQAIRRHRFGRRASVNAMPLLAVAGALSFCCSAEPAWTASLPTVTIGKAVDTIPFTVVDVALAEGYFKKNGVNAKEVLVSGSSAANAAMVGGSMQFSCEGAEPLMLARSHNVPILSIDALDDSTALQMVVSTKWLAKHPLPAKATFKQKMADLNGSVFAQVGTTEQAFYGLLRGWAGLPKLTGYKVEKLTSQAAIAIAIQRGLVDITIQTPPRSVQLTQQGYAKLLVDRRDVPQFNNVAQDILTTTSSYAKAHPKIATAVATAIAQALNFMRDHPKQTLAIEQKHFPKLSKAVLQQSLAFIPFAKDGLQSKKGWDNAVNLGQQSGLIHGITSAPEGVYWTNEYIDKSKLDK